MDVLRKILPALLADDLLVGGDEPRRESAGISASVATPARSRSANSSCSKCSRSISSTTSLYIWMKRRYESSAKRSSPEESARPFDRLVVQAEVEDRVHHSRHRGPRARADRNEERLCRIAERPADRRFDASQTLGHGALQLRRIALARARRNRCRPSVEMVKPGGTGTPMLVISARPAPFPPRTSFIPAFPRRVHRRSSRRIARSPERKASPWAAVRSSSWHLELCSNSPGGRGRRERKLAHRAAAISSTIARAAVRGSPAPVIGRPTTM